MSLFEKDLLDLGLEAYEKPLCKINRFKVLSALMISGEDGGNTGGDDNGGGSDIGDHEGDSDIWS